MSYYDNDINFLHALRQGASDAFEQLYASYYRPLCYFAEGLVGNADIAQDLATESFVKLLKKSTSFDSTQSLKSFLYTITRNACYDHLRTTKRHENSHAEISYLNGEQNDNVERQLIRAEILQAVYSAIKQLPEKYKGIIELVLLEDRKNEEIAISLRIAPQTVRNRKSEGIKLLRTALRQLQYLLSLIISYGICQLL